MAANSGAIRAGQAFVELFADDSKLVKGLRSAQARLRAYGAFVTRIGTQVFAAGSSVLSAFTGAAVVFAGMGDALDKMSARTGLAVAEIGGLKHAAEQSGAAIEDVEAATRQMALQLAAGHKGFASLGLRIDELARMSPQDQIYALSDALAAVPDQTQRASLAMQLLGDAGAKLLPMLQGGAGALKQMQAEAAQLGLVMTTAEAKSAAAFTDAMGNLWSQLKMVAAMIGSAVAPLLTDLLKRTQPLIASTIAWIRANRPLLANLFAIAAGVAAAGAAMLGLGATLNVAAWAISPMIRSFQLFAGGVNWAIKSAVWLSKILGSAVLPMLKTLGSMVLGVGKVIFAALTQGLAAGASAAAGAFGMLFTPIGLVAAALVGIAGYMLYASGVFGDLLSAGKKTWEGLKQTAVTAWGAIGTALANGNLAAAGKVAWSGLILEWTRGTNAFKDVWTKFSSFIQEVFATASMNLAEYMVHAFIGIQKAWIETTHFLADAWSAMSTGLKSGWRKTTNTIATWMAEAWAMVDDSIDAEKVITILNEDLNRNLAADQRAQENAVSQREQDRKEKMEALDGQKSAMLRSIEDERDAKLRQIQGDRDRTLAEREAALQQAQREFDAAVAAAQEAPAAKADDDSQRQLELAGLNVRQQSTGGTFSALASRMWEPKETEQQETNRLLREMLAAQRRAVRQGNFAWGA